VLWPGFSELIDPDCGCKGGPGDAAFRAPPSFGGSGLFRLSLSAVVDEDGVATGDCAASLEEPDCEGDDVPSLDSLFLDLEDLFGSLARESCSCWMGQRVINEGLRRWFEARLVPVVLLKSLTTLCLKPFIVKDQNLCFRSICLPWSMLLPCNVK